MAPTSSDERADTPQVQKQRQRSRIPSTAASQPPQARKKKASKPRPQKEPEYNLRKLLQERVEKGRTEYLVDWEDAEDGTPYPPSWEPKRNINALALAEWNEEKKQKNRKATGSRQNTPVHTGKRKRGSRQSSSAISEDIPTPKRPRRPEETRAASITELEIPDSYEQAQPGLSATSYLQVVVPLPTAEFDRSAYTKALTSSQRSEFSASKNSSGGTFQSLPESFRTGSSGCSVPQEPSENPRTYRKGLSILINHQELQHQKNSQVQRIKTNQLKKETNRADLNAGY
ncbi:endosomal cargo receptor [Phlyctema vagabunda]|uniref:Endosomal cargo receptor n=1 Tax=Phlyctema vagabunda TaxID=108571 RepID=A0ABR4PHV9_9HELO